MSDGCKAQGYWYTDEDGHPLSYSPVPIFQKPATVHIGHGKGK